MLDIQETKTTPRIIFSEESKTLAISGESYPENTFEFFKPVFEWLNSELTNCDEFILSVNIRYMNSSSTKCLLDIIDLLAEAAERGCSVSAVWYYDPENERSLDIAQEFEEDVTIPFTIMPENQSGLS